MTPTILDGRRYFVNDGLLASLNVPKPDVRFTTDQVPDAPPGTFVIVELAAGGVLVAKEGA